LQVQLEEEKLNPMSTTTSSVFIEGVEFVRVGAPLAVFAIAHAFADGGNPFPTQ
jgi:hypothetical protein